MSKVYQPKSRGAVLPTAVYNMTLWNIRSSRLYKAERDTIGLAGSPGLDGMPHGSGTSDPCFQAAIDRERFDHSQRGRILTAVEEALLEIPKEYRTGVWMNTAEGRPFPDDAGRATYSRYKQIFIYTVAKRLSYI